METLFGRQIVLSVHKRSIISNFKNSYQPENAKKISCQGHFKQTPDNQNIQYAKYNLTQETKEAHNVSLIDKSSLNEKK